MQSSTPKDQSLDKSFLAQCQAFSGASEPWRKSLRLQLSISQLKEGPTTHWQTHEEPSESLQPSACQEKDGPNWVPCTVVCWCSSSDLIPQQAVIWTESSTAGNCNFLQAIQSGKFKNVGHLRGGIYNWFRQDLPIDGDYDGSYAGRTPSVVEEKEFSYGRPPTLLETEDNLGGKTPR